MTLNVAQKSSSSGVGLLVLCFFAFNLSACKQTEKSQTDIPNIERIWQSSHCWETAAGTELLSSLAEVETWWQSIQRMQLPRPLLADEFREVDFDTHNIVVVNIGEKPTGGYGIALDREKSLLQQGVLHLALIATAPPEDSMQVQVMTQPCSVYRVDKGVAKVEAKYLN